MLSHSIFDDFDAEKFLKCMEYKSFGYSLVEVEAYYYNIIILKANFDYRIFKYVL